MITLLLFLLIRSDILWAAENPDLNEIARRLDGLDQQLLSIGSWTGFGLTILAVGLVAAVCSWVGLSVYRQIGTLRSDLANIAQKLDDTATNAARAEQISQELNIRYDELEKRIEKRVVFYRSFLLGKLRYDNSDFNEAYRHFAQAADIDGSTLEGTYYLGRCLTYRDAIDKAVELFQRYTREKGDHPRILRALALAKRFVEPEESITLFQRASALARDDSRLHATIQNEIGLVHRDRSEFEAARRYHRDAHERVPNDPVTLYFLGVAEALCNDLDTGKRHIQRAAEQAAYHAETQQIKGIWERIITLSAHIISREDDQAQAAWEGFSSSVKSGYLRDTIDANINSVCRAFGVERSAVIPALLQDDSSNINVHPPRPIRSRR